MVRIRPEVVHQLYCPEARLAAVQLKFFALRHMIACIL